MSFTRHTFLTVLLCLAAGPGCATQLSGKVDRWAADHGGCVQGESAILAQSALRRLDLTDSACQSLTIDVLDMDRPAAFAWPCGRVFVSRGLIQLLSPDELMAAIAHEVGHLRVEPTPHDQVALAGSEASHGHDACEIAADRAGTQLLTAAGVAETSMPAMLRKVAADPRISGDARSLLLRRAELLAK